jgi:hypothetical protein
MKGGVSPPVIVSSMETSNFELPESRSGSFTFFVFKKFKSLGTFDIIGSFLWYETWI